MPRLAIVVGCWTYTNLIDLPAVANDARGFIELVNGD